MQRLFLTVAACATALTTMNAVAAGPSLEPGVYEVTTRMEGSDPETKRQCVTAADVAKGMQPSNLASDCRIGRNTMTDGKLDFAATCTDASMTIAGSYTATTFKADTTLRGKQSGQSFNLVSHMAAKKVGGTCTPD